MAALVSVIIPAFNAASYIRETLQSVQAQSLSTWEALVVDDGSTDGTAQIVSKMAVSDPRITLVQQPNGGEAAARAAGLAKANAELIYFLDADDIALSDTLKRLSNALAQNPQVIAAYGGFMRIDPQGTPLYPDGKPLGKSPTPQGDILAPLLERPLFTIGAACVRKSCLTAADIVVNTNYSEDWVMWVRLALKGEFVPIGGEPLMAYRMHRANQTHQKIAVADHMKSLDVVFAMPEIQRRFSQAELQVARKRREAFCLFSLGCKELRRQDWATAADFFSQAIGGAYWNRPSIWALYALAKLGWLPPKLRQHLG